MSITATSDPLLNRTTPDRLNYANGVLLDEADFRAEQTYHRGRLARALAGLNGYGTVAGLEVRYQEADAVNKIEEEIVVRPGLAIDRLGRLIELPRKACIRLDPWYKNQTTGDLFQAFKPNAVAAGSGGVIADVYIRFVACETGKTPALSTGPFDATDGVVPSRLRDAWELKLFVRTEPADPPPLPANPWQAFGADPAKLRTAIFNAWHDDPDLPQDQRERDSDGKLRPLAGQPQGADPAVLFLARIAIPTDHAARPVRDAGRKVVAFNDKRLFAIPVGALAVWAGAL